MKYVVFHCESWCTVIKIHFINLLNSEMCFCWRLLMLFLSMFSIINWCMKLKTCFEQLISFVISFKPFQVNELRVNRLKLSHSERMHIEHDPIYIIHMPLAFLLLWCMFSQTNQRFHVQYVPSHVQGHRYIKRYMHHNRDRKCKTTSINIFTLISFIFATNLICKYQKSLSVAT